MPNNEFDMYELTLEEEDHIQEVDTVLLLSLVPLHTHRTEQEIVRLVTMLAVNS